MKRQFLPILLAAFLAASGVQAQPSAKGPEWLSRAIFYQIYPSSFQDSDGNGIGDMPGIISRLDYIQSLGVNALWLNPVYESGWFDGGYDIIDFYRIDPDSVPTATWCVSSTKPTSAACACALTW